MNWARDLGIWTVCCFLIAGWIAPSSTGETIAQIVKAYNAEMQK